MENVKNRNWEQRHTAGCKVYALQALEERN